MTDIKPVTFPIRDNRLGFLLYGASGLIYLLTFVKNMKKLMKNYDSVYYIPVVLKSSGLVDGIIEGALDQEVLKTADNFSGWNIYLCGDAQMIKKIQKQVFLKGASLKAIHADAFIPYA